MELFLESSKVASMYSNDEVIINAILAPFNVNDDPIAYKTFMRE